MFTCNLHKVNVFGKLTLQGYQICKHQVITYRVCMNYTGCNIRKSHFFLVLTYPGFFFSRGIRLKTSMVLRRYTKGLSVKKKSVDQSSLVKRYRVVKFMYIKYWKLGVFETINILLKFWGNNYVLNHKFRDRDKENQYY